MSIPMERINQNIEPKLELMQGIGDESEPIARIKLNYVEDFFTLDELDNLSGTTAFDARIQRQKESIERMAGIATRVKEELYQKLPIHKEEKASRLEYCNRVSLFLLLAASGTLDNPIDSKLMVEGVYEKSDHKVVYDEAYNTSRAMVGEGTLDHIDELYDKYENHPVMSGLRMMESAVTPMVNVRRTFLVMLDQYGQ